MHPPGIYSSTEPYFGPFSCHITLVSEGREGTLGMFVTLIPIYGVCRIVELLNCWICWIHFTPFWVINSINMPGTFLIRLKTNNTRGLSLTMKFQTKQRKSCYGLGMDAIASWYPPEPPSLEDHMWPDRQRGIRGHDGLAQILDRTKQVLSHIRPDEDVYELQ